MIAEQCCEVILEPINPANFFDLYPDVTTKGQALTKDNE